MNRTRTNDRFARTRNGSADGAKGGSRYGSPAPRRSGGPVRSGGYGRRPAAVQGEFALPETITPRCPPSRASPISTCPSNCWPNSAGRV